MSIEQAKANYLGKNTRRMNCAQAVGYAFKEKFKLGDDDLEEFYSCGGGGAPEGQCGALYAAKSLLQKDYKEFVKDCEKVFLTHAGSLKCNEIRKARKLPCLGCVQKASEFIDKI